MRNLDRGTDLTKIALSNLRESKNFSRVYVVNDHTVMLAHKDAQTCLADLESWSPTLTSRKEKFALEVEESVMSLKKFVNQWKKLAEAHFTNYYGNSFKILKWVVRKRATRSYCFLNK